MNPPPYTLQEPDTRDPAAVADAMTALSAELFPGEDGTYVRAAVREVEDIFAGRHGQFQAMDTAYHDLEHTLQSTLCALRILAGHQRAGASPAIGPRDFCIGLYAMLLHDIGYVKERDDREGTGAKHTLIHEARGCVLARALLGAQGWETAEVERVCSLIMCTGPRSNLGGTRFGNPAHRLLGQAVCTADFLSQMSDPGYVHKLPALFAELAESDRFNQVPPGQRQFHTVDDLYRNTTAFWENFVVKKFREECGDVGRYLAAPYPDGPNPYFEQVKINLAAIARLVAPAGDATAPAARQGAP